jgi:hypothetical protein
MVPDVSSGLCKCGTKLTEAAGQSYEGVGDRLWPNLCQTSTSNGRLGYDLVPLVSLILDNASKTNISQYDCIQQSAIRDKWTRLDFWLIKYTIYEIRLLYMPELINTNWYVWDIVLYLVWIDSHVMIPLDHYQLNGYDREWTQRISYYDRLFMLQTKFQKQKS